MRLFVLAIKHFEIADGFALTLIGILFTVLAGFAGVARFIWKRQQSLAEEIRALRELAEAEDTPPQPPSIARAEESGAPSPWERDGDWWKAE